VTVSSTEINTAGNGHADVRQAYAACASITRAASTNFYYAFQTLPRNKRDAIYAAYVFCRLCDDIVDEPERRGDARAELAQVRANLAACYSGGAAPDGPLWTALADAQRKFGVKQQHFSDVIAGCEMDLTQSRYTTFAELEQYCRRVASAVGLIVIEVCGYTGPQAVKHAEDLGIAMQLTNIIRDLAEDVRNGRTYIPQDELLRFGYSEAELARGETNDRSRALMAFQAGRARSYFASGEQLFQYLDRRSRACPETIAQVYRRLLDRIEASGFDVFSKRVTLSKLEKVTLAARLWLRSHAPALG